MMGKPGFRFIHAGDFLELVQFTRNIWLAGRLGSGKTLLSVALAFEMRRLGVVDYVWSNFPIRVDLLPPPPDRLLRRTLIILDEAHQIINARDFQDNNREYGAYARKVQSVWLYPSIDTIDKRVRQVRVQRAFRVDFTPVGIWVYRYQLMLGDEHDQGWFLLWSPESVMGLYDHRYIPIDDAGILGAWRATMQDKIMKQGGVWDPLSAGKWGHNG